MKFVSRFNISAIFNEQVTTQRILNLIKCLQLALIKAFAPVYPLIQLAYYSCKYEKNQLLNNSLDSLLVVSPISNSGMINITFF